MASSSETRPFIELCKNQTALMEEINSLKEAARKMGKKRTIKFLEDKFDKSRQLWITFQQTDSYIQTHEERNLTAAYDADETYETAKQLYVKTRGKLDEYRELLEQDEESEYEINETTSSNRNKATPSREEVEQMVGQQRRKSESIKRRIDEICDQINEISNWNKK